MHLRRPCATGHDSDLKSLRPVERCLDRFRLRIAGLPARQLSLLSIHVVRATQAIRFRIGWEVRKQAKVAADLGLCAAVAFVCAVLVLCLDLR